MKRAVIFAVIFFVAPAAHAAFTSGKQLSQGCGKRDMAGEFFCMAYISGVLDSNSQCGPYLFDLREAMGMVAGGLGRCKPPSERRSTAGRRSAWRRGRHRRRGSDIRPECPMISA